MHQNRASQSSGKKIIRSASVVYYVLGILTFLASFVVCYLCILHRNPLGAVLFTMLTLVGGLVFTLVVYRLMRGFGEMVQNTAEIADLMEEMRDSKRQNG